MLKVHHGTIKSRMFIVVSVILRLTIFKTNTVSKKKHI